MNCNKCNYYKEGVTDCGPFNECNLFGFEYFHIFLDKCSYIDDNYYLTEEGKEIQEFF